MGSLAETHDRGEGEGCHWKITPSTPPIGGSQLHPRRGHIIEIEGGGVNPPMGDVDKSLVMYTAPLEGCDVTDLL